ncbi:globin [Photobacterium sp. 1_MG-2023]|uniref:globin domain-containing protein n=1 Tax=Photobacterium sp. 1_MG-2023 TaxID=3062646 RepID=UPI0026E1A633|nr:globin [Photobacterium sp. 1_MG-2023]MDO6707361.1 globin [Photobacterium sp. 1_MG-2023]
MKHRVLESVTVIPPERDISDIVSLDIKDYSKGQNRLNAAGGQAGICQLADAFCHCLDTLPEVAVLRQKYPDDLAEFHQSLQAFLKAWMSGETPLYTKSNGRRYLSANRKRLRLTTAEKNAWLYCMQKALDAQPYDEVFKRYVMVQLGLAAEMIRNPSPES